MLVFLHLDDANTGRFSDLTLIVSYMQGSPFVSLLSRFRLFAENILFLVLPFRGIPSTIRGLCHELSVD